MELINDRYQLLEVIASGGMATVWKARDTRLDRLVAVKRPHPGPPGDQSAERLGREARAAASLNHPNLITVYDFGTDETGPYLVMELVDGPSLQDLAARLESAEVIDIGARLADALAAIHAAGIVHRDVTPANVIMSERGPLLTDFGIATDPDATAELTQPGMVVATPSYAAPEVLGGEAPSPASDVYSLGVVIDELIRKTGTAPDESVDRAVASAVANSPSARPDAAGLADALARSVSTVSTPVPSEGTTMILETTPSAPASAPSDDEDRETPAWMWVAGILVLAAAGLTVLGLVMSEDDPPADAAIVPTTVVADDSTTTSSTTTSSTTTMITTTTLASVDARITEARNELEAVLSRPPRSDFKRSEVEDVMKKVDEGIEAARGGDMDEAEEKLEEVEEQIDDKLSGDRLDDARAALYELADLLGVELDGDR